MVKLDLEVLRYMTRDEWRVLTAVEMGMKNHEIVPTPLIQKIAGLQRGGCFKVIGALHKNKLLNHDAKTYDGYRLTYQGYDYLALKALVARGMLTAVGRQIGVGKESDIYECVNDEGERMVLKIHRLGRISFRAIKTKRDYLQKRSAASWLYMSRLAALREFAYMKALFEHGFPTPRPVDSNRHCVLMSLVEGHPLCQVRRLANPGEIYAELMELIVRLAEHGLIHGDFNEFNLMLDDKRRLTMIDFPQIVSTQHTNAKMLFDRDVRCVRDYFARKFHFESVSFPQFFRDTERKVALDVELDASGAVSQKEGRDLEEYMKQQRNVEEIVNEEEEEEEGEEKEAVEEEDGEKEEEEAARDAELKWKQQERMRRKLKRDRQLDEREVRARLQKGFNKKQEQTGRRHAKRVGRNEQKNKNQRRVRAEIRQL